MSTALRTRTITAATTPPTIGPRFVLGPEEGYVEAVLLGVEDVGNLHVCQYRAD